MAERDLVVRLIGDDASLRRAFTRSSVGTKQFTRDVSAATRGAAAGSGAFRSLGRSIVFASGGFLAFTSGAAFLRKTIDAAKEAQVANAQLATQLANSGKSFERYRAQIDATINRLSALAGIEDDELKQGLTTILRTVPDVTKALSDLSLATDLARARHIALSQAAVIIAKTEAGNTTLLRRQGFQIKQNATAEQALAKVRAVVAGQAAAGTTAQERFGAVLHQTEEIIGTGILPTLNKYLEAGSKWLQQMNESGKLQRDVASAAHDFERAMSAVSGTVKTVNKITGSFKNTLELLAAVFLAKRLVVWADGMGLFATRERLAAARATELRIALSKLAAIGVITIGVEILLNKKTIDNKVSSFLDEHGLGFLGGANRLNAKGLNLGNIDKAIATAKKLDDSLLAEALTKYKAFLNSQDAKAAAALSATRGSGPHGAALLAQKIAEAEAPTVKAKRLTAAQRNAFFDNTISRILLRGGLGGITQQIAALRKADTLIEQRIAATKDVTRRLNLEDELLQNQAQIRGLQAQQVADKLAAAEAARQKAIDALQKKLAARDARQFSILGFGPTGEDRVPLVRTLKRQLANVSQAVQGTFLDTNKTKSVLGNIQKVLSAGVGNVSKEVRSKIKEMLDGINQQLEGHAKTLTKFRHTNANALLAGLGLDPETTRILRQRLAQVGPGGTVPGVRSDAFAGAGATTVIPITVDLDGKTIAKNTTTHQRRQNQRRSESRRGPYAGRH